ncbi:MAG: ATP-binding protein, partial [Gaiellaceae bacterium]
ERDRLHRLLEQLQEGVIAVDRDLTVEFANTRAHALLGPGLTPDRPLPDPWPHFSLRDAVGSLFTSGSEARTIRTNPTASTTYVVALLPPTPSSQAGVIVITDVTEDERRERAEREFVMNAAHELRTPLAAIASAVEVLQQGAKEERADRDRFLAIVERQTTRLTRLARALLTLARAQTRSEPIRLEPVPVSALVHEIAADAGKPDIVVDVCCDPVDVRAHRELLHQALENLISNARKHGGGPVTIQVAHDDDDEHVRVAVTDTGRGMEPRDTERVLDRFYRAPGSNDDGFGLGLSIVREVVEVMGGTMSIDSRPERGTTVSIVLESAGTARSCR